MEIQVLSLSESSLAPRDLHLEFLDQDLSLTLHLLKIHLTNHRHRLILVAHRQNLEYRLIILQHSRYVRSLPVFRLF